MTARVPIRRVLTIVVAACLMALAISAQPFAQASSRPQIDSVALDGTTLTISGKNFGSAPTVKVGESTLTIARSSDTEIVAESAALAAGIYSLSVSRDATEDGTANSSLTVQ